MFAGNLFAIFAPRLSDRALLMKLASFFLSAISLLILATLTHCQSDSQNMNQTPPIAKVVPHSLEKHGHTRIDNYYWLREREDQEVIDYLNAENKYSRAQLKHTTSLQEELFEEMVGRVKKDDSSVPYKLDDYYYYTRYEGEQEYPFYCRKTGSMESVEEVMLDVNILAKDHSYFKVASSKISTNHEILAYSVDTVSRRIYTVHFKNLKTGETLSETLPNVTGNMVWANDNKTLFYGRQDTETLRSHQIFRHTIGTDPAEDVLVYEETDDTFSTYVSKTKSKKYLVISAASTLSEECRILSVDNPTGEFRMFQARQPKLEYSIDHLGDAFYILTNHEAKNFRLMKSGEAKTGLENWEEVIAHRSETLLESFELYQDYLVLDERANGLNRLRIKRWDGADDHYIEFQDPAYMCYLGFNPEANTSTLRYGYQSLTTPGSTYDYDMATKEKTLLKQTEVLGKFQSSDYQSERFFVEARDGAQVPVSVVYHKNTPRDGKAPLLLYAYGSYGYSMDPYFSSARLSLLDRGFIYVIAHIRGGSEMGRNWYEDGKMLNKKNTFTDFIDCGDYLIEKSYTQSDRIFAMGGSAGGLLMGAVLNMRPNLFHGMVASVPFVDVITTMLDESIPLTTGEYDEWGNPNNKEYYDYILSYSPYDNVAASDYTNLLVMTGLHDSQVQYWEPAKWVAKMRAIKTGEKRLLLHTNMEAGHSGASGRFEAYHEVAMEYAFMLDLAEGRAGD